MALEDLFIDPEELPEGVYGAVQLTFLLAVYGYILFTASNLISDGSELLLLIPSLAGLVGSVVLPVLGAVPDGAIVLFSGLGDDAQQQLSVGVGALAGSTIMLLCIPWSLSVYAGRVNLDKGTGLAVYKRPHGVNFKNWQKLHPPNNKNLFRTGVSGYYSQLKMGGVLMLITVVPFLIIQGPAFYLDGNDDATISKGEKGYALAGMIICSVLFVSYLYYQWWLVSTGRDKLLEDTIEEIRRNKILRGEISLVGCMQEELRLLSVQDGSDPKGSGYRAITGGGGGSDSKAIARLKSLLFPFFDKYDTNDSGTLDVEELHAVFKDLNEDVKQRDLVQLFSDFDSDADGTVSFDEFVHGVAKYVAEKHPAAVEEGAETSSTVEKGQVQGAEVDDDGEEHEEVPEDLAHLSPEEQQRRIKLRSCYMMAAGTATVLLFSDPMVGVLSEVGARTGINPFFISFIFAPLASNASELIAAYKYSLKKTSKTITISLSTLQGAAIMNNSFSLGIFLALIYFRGLVWEYSAETLAILVVEVAVALFSFRQTQRLLDAIMVLSLYPASLALVVLLEKAGWN